MRINTSKSLFLLVALFIIVGCRSLKTGNYLNNSFKGEIKIKNEETFNLKFRLYLDSLNRINLKLYSSTGFRIGSFKIYSDSMSIIDLYDMSYKKYVVDVFNGLKDEIYLNDFIMKLIKGRLFEEKNTFSKNRNCEYSLIDDDLKNNKIDILAKDCSKLFSVFGKGNLNISRDRIYEIVVSKNFDIEILIKSF
jgi:hypothetical protein